MQLLLRSFVWLFGVVCCLIALTHIVLGPSSIPGSIPGNAIMDSEDRFYATLFLGFGGGLIWCSGDILQRGRLFEALLLVFFLGGVARLISAAVVGPPSPLFICLGGLELILPPLLVWWRRRLAAIVDQR